jgi:hypothetical protein
LQETDVKKLTALIVVMWSALTLLGADLTGTWSVAVVLDAGTGAATFTFKQTGEALTGTYTGTFGSAQVTGTVKGDQIEWSFDNDQVGKVTYQGTVDAAGKIKGTVIYGQLGKGSFVGEKK